MGATGGSWLDGTEVVRYSSTIGGVYAEADDEKVTTYIPVTNFQYEENKNEERRVVRILREDYIEAVIDSLDRIMK